MTTKTLLNMNLNQSAFAEGRSLSRKRQIPLRAFVKIPKLLLSLLLLVLLSFQSHAQLDPPPFVDFGSEFTIELDENGHAAVTIDAVGGDEFDDNGEPLTFTFSQTDFDCSNIGVPTAVIITVTNAAGISASTVMNAIVEDNMGPILVTNHVVVQLDADGNGSFTSEEVFSTDSRDNCDGPITLQGGDQTVNRDDVARSPFEVVVKGQDQNGNTTRTRATITVLDYVEEVVPLIFTSTPITTIDDDQEYNYTINAEDRNGESVSVTASELPNWLTLVSNAGGIVATVAGSGQAGFVDNTGDLAEFNAPAGVAVDANGNIFVADQNNHVIRRIDAEGRLYTYAGDGMPGFVEGPTDYASFHKPAGMALDNEGNLIVADSENHSIRRVTPDGLVLTVAGIGQAGFINGDSTMASFHSPMDVAVDAQGNIFVADQGNHVIRKIDTDGRVSTYAGTGMPGFIEGPTDYASFHKPTGLALDNQGNLIVADSESHSIRRVTPDGLVLTVAGTGWAGFINGDSITSSFHSPKGVAVDGGGNIFVSDQGNQVIRKIDANGQVSTYAGSGMQGLVNGSNLYAGFNNPQDLAFDRQGNLIVADLENNAIRILTSGETELVGNPGGQPGVYAVTLNANDTFGETTEQTFNITVNDVTAPTIITQNISIELEADGSVSITPEQIDNGSSDNAGGELAYTLDRTDFSCNELSVSCSGSSLSFNGTGIASGANQDNIQNLGLNQLTMEAWVKPNGGIVNSIIRKAGDYDLYIVNNILYAEVWFEGRASSAQYLYAGPNVSDNTWSHLAFTFDKANGGSGKFYVNGIETVATGTFRSIAPDITLGIGGSTEFGQSFTGLIDDVRIWSVERTNAEINEFKDFCIDANSVGLEAYFKIEANEGTTLTDYSGNGNNLTITGASWSFEGAPIESDGTDVTLTVTDAAGNASAGIANVFVLDNSAPVIAAPTDISVNATSAAGAVVNYTTPVGTDNCSVATALIAGFADGTTFPIGTTVVTYTATDASGNAASASFNVEVVGLAPEIVVTDIIVSNDEGQCGAIVDFAATETVGIPASVITYDIAPGSNFIVGITTVTATATNAVDTSVSTFDVTVRDITAPTVIAQDVVVQLNENGVAILTPEEVNVGSFDNCEIASMTLTRTDFSCENVGESLPGVVTATMTVDNLFSLYLSTSPTEQGTLIGSNSIWETVTTHTGNLVPGQTYYLHVKAEDVGGPEMFIGDFTVNGSFQFVNGQQSMSTNAANWTLSESAFGVNPQIPRDLGATNFSPIWGTTPGISSNARYIWKQNWNTPGNEVVYFTTPITFTGNVNETTLTVTDINGNASSQTVNVKVEDNIAPDVVGNNTSVTLTANGTVSIALQDVLVSGADNCGLVTYTLSQDTFEAADAINSPVTIQLTGTDPSGNATSVDVQVTVIDPVPVVVTQDIVVSLDENGNAIITPEQIDNGSSSVVGLSGLALDISNFDCSNVGTPFTVTLTATSTLGSSAVGTAVVTVEDNAGPEFLTRESFIIFLDADGVATVTPDQFNRDTVTDNCGVETITFDKTTFNCDEVGFHVINITAYDVHGNSTIGQADVEVRDEIAPIFATRESFIILLDENGQASVTPVDYNRETIITNCNLDRIEFDRTDFGCDDVGFHVINVTAFDGNGLATTTQADVEVRDEIAPTVIIKNIIVDLDENGNATISPSDVDGGTFDNCAFTLSLNIDSFTCAQVGENIVELTAHDQNGVFTSANATVTVRDVTAPEFLTRESYIIYLDANGVATVTPDQFNRDTVTDNCGVETITFDKTTFNCDEVGFHVINITAYDVHGNSTIGQADVEVRDEIAPTVITQNIIVDLDENGNATISPSDVDGGTFDNCAFTLSLNIDSFTCAQVGENRIELTAHDQNGVFASAIATVTVRDVTAPTVITKDVTVGLDANGAYTVTADDINDGTFDNCTFNLSVTNNVFDCSTLGEHTVILTATDASGNTTSASAVVTVVDNAGPVIVVKDIDVFLDENGNASITLDDVNEGITDGCGVTNTTIDITSFDCSNLGANTVTLTATDIHGNTSTGTATVTVIDNIAPTVNTKNITVDLDANGNATISPIDVVVQEETTEYCSVSNAGGYGMLLFQYVKRYRNRPYGRATVFTFITRGRTFRKNPDGTATITGTLVDRSDSRDSWSVRLNLKNARDWEEWSALGKTYEGNRRVIGDKYLDWTYYEMGENSQLIGTGINRGETIQLAATGRGFQVGEAANSLNSNFGISGQFRYAPRRGRGSTGRFYFDLDNCISRTKTPEGPLTEDNCSIASTSLDVTSFDCSNIGDNIVNVTVKDKSGNATTVPATVTVRDVIKPVARAKNITVTLGADGTVTIDPKLLDGGSTDNCEIVSYSLSRDTFTCRDIQYQSYYRRGLSVTLTVTDAAGNSSHAVASVYVTERQAPVISTEPITLVVYGRQRAQVSRREISKRVTDNCGVQRLYHQRGFFSRSNAGLNYLWVVAIDNSGNRTNGFVRVNVVDVTKYGRVVPMCYNGRPIRTRASQVQRWLSRGATIGLCDTDIAMSAGGTNLNDALELEVTVEPLIELGAFPNPSQGETTIKFSSDVAGPAMAVVMSPNGVRMNTLFDGELAANENVEIRYNTSELPSGVYIIRLVTAGEIRNLKLIVQK